MNLKSKYYLSILGSFQGAFLKIWKEEKGKMCYFVVSEQSIPFAVSSYYYTTCAILT